VSHSESGRSTSPTAKTFQTVVLVLITITLVSGGLYYWKTQRQAGAEGWSGGGPIDVVATTVQATDAPVTLEALGEVRAVNQVSLSADVAGRVSDIAFEPGENVEAGTLLVQLDDATEQAELAAANADARFARDQFQRAEGLFSKDAISRELLQQRLAERDRAVANVKQIEARIRQKQIRAPFDGKLGLRHIDLGEQINAGDTVVSLTDLATLNIRFDVPQRELARVKVGQQIHLQSDVSGQETMVATIGVIEPQVNQNTRNVTLQATLDNRDGKLQPGMYVSVGVQLPEEPDALVLPATAVVTSSSGDTAVVVRDLSEDNIGQGETVPVVVGRRFGDHLVIEKGLKPGDVVLTEGQLRVRPGADLKVQTLSPTTNADSGGAS
jgi:multidrug efflux system membrane fusion protein